MSSGPPAFAFELQPAIRSRKELQSRFSITSSRGIPSQEFTPNAAGAVSHENLSYPVMLVWF